ncbi:hypothetical protein [Bermanella sp. R86510]
MKSFIEAVQAFFQQWMLDQAKPQPIRIDIEQEHRQQIQRRKHR